MARSRTVVASVLGCALVWIVATVSVLAVDRKPGPDKRSNPSSGYRGRGWGRGRGWSRGGGYYGGGGHYGRVYEEKPFTFCPPPCRK
jgi:uncharacterized membrane protein YgcG